jgi:hypothetical protein
MGLPRMQGTLGHLKETKLMILDKTAAASLDLILHWDAEEQMTGDVGMSYVKHTGSLLSDAMKTVNVLDFAYDKGTPLFNYRFAPERKFTWLFSGMNKKKLKNAANYWGQYVHAYAPDQVSGALSSAGIRKDRRHHAHRGI